MVMYGWSKWYGFSSREKGRAMSANRSDFKWTPLIIDNRYEKAERESDRETERRERRAPTTPNVPSQPFPTVAQLKSTWNLTSPRRQTSRHRRHTAGTEVVNVFEWKAKCKCMLECRCWCVWYFFGRKGSERLNTVFRVCWSKAMGLRRLRLHLDYLHEDRCKVKINISRTLTSASTWTKIIARISSGTAGRCRLP